MKKIALEEAFTAPGLEKYLERTLILVTEEKPRAELRHALEDMSEQRLAAALRPRPWFSRRPG